MSEAQSLLDLDRLEGLTPDDISHCGRLLENIFRVHIGMGSVNTHVIMSSTTYQKLNKYLSRYDTYIPGEILEVNLTMAISNDLAEWDFKFR